MDITRFAIQNDRVTIVAVVLVAVAGVNAFLTLPQAEDPGFIVRTAMVQTLFPGANPERVENLVTDRIEEEIQSMPELDVVRSESKTGVSIIYVDIKDSYKNMRPIWDSLRRKVQSAAADLPDGIVGPFVNDEFGDVFGTIISLTAGTREDGSPEVSYAELKTIAEQARDRLLQLEDVAKVDLYGVQDERIFVEYDNSRLAELGLSVVQLQQALESRNIVLPGGNITTAVERLELEPSGNFDDLDDIRRTVISAPGRSEFLYLEDIAEVRRGYIDPPRTKMRANGLPALGLAVAMKSDGNIVELGYQIGAVVEEFNRSFPLGIDFDMVAYQSERVERKVNEFTVNVEQAIAIVLGVMLIMLGLRTGLVVASLVPSAMLATLVVMRFMEIGIDQMSLAALIIALGMLVDNAIVMSESIMVQMAAGKPRIDAAVDSANELKISLLTSSLTTSAAFLPIYLAESQTGEYTGVLFLVVTITLLSSWLLSLTIVPLLCVKFLKVEPAGEEATYKGRFYRLYRGILLSVLRFRLLSAAAVIALFFVSLKGMDYLPNIFFPASDTPMFTAEIESPIGTSIERSEEIAVEIDRFVQGELVRTDERPEGVTAWSTYVGQGGPRFSLAYTPEPTNPAYSFLLFNATSRDSFADVIPRIEQFCADRFPDVQATVKPLALGAPIKNPVEVHISGSDVRTLFNLADSVKAKLEEFRGTRNIGDDWGAQTKKIAVEISGTNAKRSGITNQDVAVSLQSVLSGYTATDFREGNEIIPVVLRSTLAGRKDIGKLESLNVYSQATGRSVPLQQIASLDIEFQPAKILRRARLKSVKVYAALEPGITATQVTDDLIPWLTEQQASWPVGYRWELGGEYEQSGQANASIAEKLPFGGLIIVLLLVAQFNSIRKPLIILLTIPLGMIGVIAGLLIAKSYFGFMTLLGVISLAGIVINNAIVLIDRIDLEINVNGRPPDRAVIEATQRRLRPILLTTLTTVGGLIPLWLGGGPMWEPMAIAIIFGLTFATVLTLGVVPLLYSLFYRVSFKGFRYEPAAPISA